MKPADEIRVKLVELFEQAKPMLAEWTKYSEKAITLSREYHAQRLKEQFPDVEVEWLVPLASLPAQATPVSLDRALAELGDHPPVKRIIFDPTRQTYTLLIPCKTN